MSITKRTSGATKSPVYGPIGFWRRKPTLLKRCARNQYQRRRSASVILWRNDFARARLGQAIGRCFGGCGPPSGTVARSDLPLFISIFQNLRIPETKDAISFRTEPWHRGDGRYWRELRMQSGALDPPPASRE